MYATDKNERSGGPAVEPPAWWRRLAWPPWDLALEPVSRAHAGRVRRVLTAEIARWLGIGAVDEMRAGTAVWAMESPALAAERSAYRYLLERSGRFAGVVELRPDAVRGHIGYWLRRSERGRGTVTLANRLLLPIAFEGLGLRAVDWTTDAENAASIAVVERLGARIVSSGPSRVPGREVEVRYRLERRRFHADPTGPGGLRHLLHESDNE